MWKMTNSILTILTIMIFFVALVSCSDSDSNNSQIGPPYTGFIPNFSVNLPENVVSDSYINGNASSSKFTSSTSMQKLNLNNLLNVVSDSYINNGNSNSIQKLNLEENPDVIDCSSVLETLNTWEQDVDRGLPQNQTNDADSTKALGYTLHFYALSQFYDCNLRQQVLEDGVDRQCILREGEESGSPENLCHEDENADTSTQFSYTLLQDSELPDDFTRFVGWTSDPNDPTNNNVQGMMLNKYLEDDGGRTKTRIDLHEDETQKIIISTFLGYDTNSEGHSMTRSYFREIKPSDGSAATENYIVGRYWNKVFGGVISLRAHLKSSVGSVLFITICQNVVNLEDAIASTCSSGAASTTYFDSEGTQIGPTADFSGQLSTSATDSNFNPENASDNLDTFFNSESIDEYFDIDNFAPENNPQPPDDSTDP